VEGLECYEVISESNSAGLGQQGDPVLLPLAAADRDLAETEINVLDAETEALDDPHSGAVEREDDQLDGALEPTEDGGHLFFCQDAREPFRLAGADDVLDPRGVDLQDLAVEKEDGAEVGRSTPFLRAWISRAWRSWLARSGPPLERTQSRDSIHSRVSMVCDCRFWLCRRTFLPLGGRRFSKGAHRP